MKKIRFVLSMLMLFLASALMPAMAQDFTGKWHVKMTESPMGDMEFDMTIKKSESGTYSLEMGGGAMSAEVKSVTVNDNKMTITVSTTGMDIPFEMNLKEDDTLEGNIMGTIKLNGTRVKE